MAQGDSTFWWQLAAGVALLAAVVPVGLWLRDRALRRQAFIRAYPFPKGLYERWHQHHPELEVKDFQLVCQGLRQFFLAYLRGGRRYVSMPSQVVDDLWHEFILYTRNYERFCRQAFGGFLHHTPAVALGDRRLCDQGLRRCWHQTCREERINPRTPTRLPLLFALDAKLNIVGGFVYAANCVLLTASGSAAAAGQGVVHCGADLGAPTDRGGDSSGGFDDAGDGCGGDGDGGCGGGCGGGD